MPLLDLFPNLLAAAAPAVEPLRGLEAILEADGFGITITGMLIVFVALIAISLFIGLLPKVLGVLEPYLPDLESHGPESPSVTAVAPANSTGKLDPRLVAAVAWAWRQECR